MELRSRKQKKGSQLQKKSFCAGPRVRHKAPLNVVKTFLKTGSREQCFTVKIVPGFAESSKK